MHNNLSSRQRTKSGASAGLDSFFPSMARECHSLSGSETKNICRPRLTPWWAKSGSHSDIYHTFFMKYNFAAIVTYFPKDPFSLVEGLLVHSQNLYTDCILLTSPQQRHHLIASQIHIFQPNHMLRNFLWLAACNINIRLLSCQKQNQQVLFCCQNCFLFWRNLRAEVTWEWCR